MYYLLVIILIVFVFFILKRTIEPFFTEETIFVSIASYRDLECQKTLKSLYTNARHPSRVFVGICQQNEHEDESCLYNNNPYANNVRTMTLHASDAKGPTYARFLCSTLYNNETYYLQIDSHTSFVKDWDVLLLDMYKKIKDPRAILSYYPRGTDAIDTTDHNNVPTMCGLHYESDTFIFEAKELAVRSKIPAPSTFASAGFIFGRGQFVRDVPFDPNLDYLFTGEEFLYSARLYTNGYNFYTPTKHICYHEYGRSEKPRYWDKMDYAQKAKNAIERHQRILKFPGTQPMSPDRYGLGQVRTMENYYKFLNLDFEKKASSWC